MTLREGPLWRSNLQIRELLRSDASLVQAYVHVKRAALRDGHTTLIAYSQHKAKLLGELARRK